MMRKTILAVIGVGIIGVLPGLIMAEEIRLTSCKWKPYAGEDLPNYGFSSEIEERAETYAISAPLYHESGDFLCKKRYACQQLQKPP